MDPKELYVIHRNSLNRIIKYLGQQPFDEVEELIDEVRGAAPLTSLRIPRAAEDPQPPEDPKEPEDE